MRTSVKLKNLRIAPRKMQLIADSIRKKPVTVALNALQFQKKKGSIYLYKLLLSALASWQEKYEDKSIEDYVLYVSHIYVTQGKVMKRFKPAPQGRAHPIKKYMSHTFMTIDVWEEKEEKQNQEEEKTAVEATTNEI